MAGFEVSTYGRFWVSTEAAECAAQFLQRRRPSPHPHSRLVRGGRSSLPFRSAAPWSFGYWAKSGYLSANLPGYDTYCQKVRYRLLPLVW